MPDEKQRREIISHLLHDVSLSKDVSIADIALRTASFSPRDLQSLVDLAIANAMRRVVGRPPASRSASAGKQSAKYVSHHL
jgi:SpoVK/Ycf46/Vps4 family AAA+-type ATPase